MRRLTLPLALTLASLLGLLAVAPASAATTGTLCGEVTAFTAPVGSVDGSITIDGTTEVIDSAATLSAATLTTLAALAAADATTCLDITADGSSVITAIAIAVQAEICGEVAFDTTLGAYTIDGVAIPATLVSANAELEALLDAAATAYATLCADVTVDATTGLFTTVSVSGTLRVCGTASLDADSATVGGVDVPLSLLDAEARAMLALAIDANVAVCLDLVVDDSDLVQANLTASVDLCGEVTLDAGGNVVVDGTIIPAELLDANAAALLRLAAEADGTACAAVDASSTGGNTVVGATVTIEVCAEVTAIGDGTITLGDVTFVFAGAADAGIEVGDVICVAASTAPTGDPVITDTDTSDGTPGAAPGADDTGPGGEPLLPDTAIPAGGSGASSALILAGLVALVGAAVTRSREAARG